MHFYKQPKYMYL